MDTDIKVPEERFKDLISKHGISDCDLRPSGIAIINEERYDVQTKGEYITAGTPIIVSAIEGDHIYVKENLTKEEHS